MQIKNILIIFLLLLCLFSFVSAVDYSNQVTDSDVKLMLNEFGILGNAIVNVTDGETNQIYGVKVENQAVTSVIEGVMEKPNYSIYVSVGAKNALVSSNDPAKEAIAQLKKGNIQVTAHGFVETIQLFFFNIFLAFQ